MVFLLKYVSKFNIKSRIYFNFGFKKPTEWIEMKNVYFYKIKNK